MLTALETQIDWSVITDAKILREFEDFLSQDEHSVLEDIMTGSLVDVCCSALLEDTMTGSLVDVCCSAR